MNHSNMHGAEGRQACHAAVLAQEVVPPAPNALLGLHLAGELFQAGCRIHLEVLDQRWVDLAVAWSHFVKTSVLSAMTLISYCDGWVSCRVIALSCKQDSAFQRPGKWTLEQQCGSFKHTKVV